MKAKKVSRRSSKSSANLTGHTLSLVRIPERRINQYLEEEMIDASIRTEVMRSAVGMPVSGDYTQSIGVGRSERKSLKRPSTRKTTKKGTILIIAGPKDKGASSFASSLSKKYDVVICTKITECKKQFEARKPDILLGFVKEMNEVKLLHYFKKVSGEKSNDSLLVMVASHHYKLEERLHYYWAGIDTHLLLPATSLEMDEIVTSWKS